MTSPCQAAKAKHVPLSKFEPETNLPYEKLNTKLQVVRNRLNRPLTLSEKVLYSHLAEPETQVIKKNLIDRINLSYNSPRRSL